MGVGISRREGMQKVQLSFGMPRESIVENFCLCLRTDRRRTWAWALAGRRACRQ